VAALAFERSGRGMRGAQGLNGSMDSSWTAQTAATHVKSSGSGRAGQRSTEAQRVGIRGCLRRAGWVADDR
jgi:hypothetical protein